MAPSPAVDPVLELLRAMDLTGAVFLEAEFTSPWCVVTNVRLEDRGDFLAESGHVIAYHYVMEGRCSVAVEGDPPREVQAGEIVILPRNERHRLGSALDVRAIGADQLVQPAVDKGLARIVHGGGGERTRVLCGFLSTSTPNPPIASVLPPALTVAVRDGVSGSWIESSFRFAAQELIAGKPGSLAIAAKLAELLFMEAVRRHVEAVPTEQRGWLTGLRDPIVARALALLHGRKAHRWTVTELARESGASRSAFADRFTNVIGESPMRHLARQRLRVAAQRLRQGGEAIAHVAYDVGYESEAAFSRAFKREFGKSPAAWRKQ